MSTTHQFNAPSKGPDQAERYRAIQIEAVLSLIAGICSIGMFFHWLFFVFVIAAVAIGYRSLKAIERTPEEYTGKNLAMAGIGLGIFFALSGSIYQTMFRTEVPHGYEVLEWSDLLAAPGKNEGPIPAKLLELSDNKTKVYIKGYILPGNRQSGLKEFAICRTADMCRFGMPITNKRELIRIKLSADLSIDYTNEIIGVGGVFNVDQYDPNGMPFSIQTDYLYY